MQNWNDIWKNKKVDVNTKETLGFDDLFIKMKLADGYDSGGAKTINTRAMYDELDTEIDRLNDNREPPIRSIYEVGCGSGPDLLYFKRKNPDYRIGGMDLSENLIRIAKEFIPSAELAVGEAHRIDTSNHYDSVVMKGVVQYFDSMTVVTDVFDKLIEKADYSVGILHILDEEKRKPYFENCKKRIPNYDERYSGLNYTFLSKDFLIQYADTHHLDVKIYDTYIEGYYNNGYMMDAFYYKR